MAWANDEVLDVCTDSVGVAYDPVLGRQAIYQAEREIPGPDESTWVDRMKLVGKQFGLRMGEVELTAHQAVRLSRPSAPVLCYVPAEGGRPGDWVVLVNNKKGRKVRLAGSDRGDRLSWISTREVFRRLRIEDPNATMTWLIAMSIAPLHPMHDPGGSLIYPPGRLRGHGHGQVLHAGQPNGQSEAPSPLQRMFGLFRQEFRLDFWMIFSYVIGIAFLMLTIPMTVETIVSVVAMNLMIDQLVVMLFLMFGGLATAAALRGVQIYMIEMWERRLYARVASDYGYRLPLVRPEVYDAGHLPERINRFFSVSNVEKASALLLLEGLSTVVVTLMGMILLVFYHPFLIGMDVILLMAMTVLVVLLGRGANRTKIQETSGQYEIAATLEELVRVPLLFKGDGGMEYALDRADASTRRYIAARRRHFAILMRQVGFILAMQVFATTAMFGLGGYLVIEGELTVGQLVAAELIVVMIVGSFGSLIKHIEAWYILLANVDKLGIIVDLPLERVDGEGYVDPEEPAAELKVHGLSFAYAEPQMVLDQLDLDVRRGERVALVGPSGSGKTTLLDLIFGLREPHSGGVAIDGNTVSDLRLGSLRQRVALIRGVEVIEDTILENVRAGRMWVTLADARRALEDVRLMEIVDRMPGGIYTRVFANGRPLSQGQARRLMLARAIVGRPRLLLIDEELDSLDLNVRHRVLDTLMAQQAPWTLLIVTHARDIVERCDRVVALVEGKAGHSLVLDRDGAGHADTEGGEELGDDDARPKDFDEWLKETGACRIM